MTFSHTIFAMPFALLSVFIGMYAMPEVLSQPRALLVTFWLVVLCMIFARSAAMAFNRYLDADIDAKNERTRSREIPSGVISRRRAFVFTLLMSALFVLTTYFINKTCFLLSPIALAVVLGYSYTKRFTSLCHMVLGLGLALAPVGAYIAVTENINMGVVFLGISVLLWVAGFDIIYSLQDRQFDKSENLHSIPVLMGTRRAIRFSIFLHILSIITLTVSMQMLIGLEHVLVILALIFFIVMVYVQHTLYTSTDYSRINKKYMTTNGIVSLIFCGLVVVGILLEL